MIELLSTETKPVYIGYNKLAADVAEATTDGPLRWTHHHGRVRYAGRGIVLEVVGDVHAA